MALDVNTENFENEVLESDKPVLIDFWAPWCGPCKMITPLVEGVSKERNDVKVVKINVDENPEIAQKYMVRGLPTVMIIKSGNVSATKIGAMSKGDLNLFLEENV